MSILIYNLSKTFNFYFSEKKGLFFFKCILHSINLFSVIKLPYFYFFFKNMQNLILMVFSKFFYKTLLRNFMNFYKKFFCFYFFKMKLKGLGFRIRKISKNYLYRFFFTSTNFIYFHVPSSCIFKTKGRRIFFICNDRYKLSTIITHMLLLRNIVPYRIRGLLYPRELISMKPGKKRF